MFCRNCGNALPDDARFCNNCGLELYAQQSHAQNVNQPIYNQKPKKNTLKYIIFAIVGLVLGIAIGMVIFLRSNDNSMAGGQRTEGSGFKTPQEAAKAYIDNYGKTSAEEMYKLFAIESSVDNYTLEKQTERLKAYSNTLSVKLPVYGSVSRNIAIENKKSDINRMMFYQYRTLMGWSDEAMLGNIAKGDNSSQTIIDENMPNNEYSIAEGLIVDKVYTDDDIKLDLYHSDSVNKNRREMANTLNAQDIQDVIVVFHTQKGYYACFLGAAKYNGRWYLDEHASFIPLILGLEQHKGGMIELGTAFDENAILSGSIR